MKRWLMVLPLALFLLVAVFCIAACTWTRPNCRRR